MSKVSISKVARAGVALVGSAGYAESVVLGVREDGTVDVMVSSNRNKSPRTRTALLKALAKVSQAA